MTTTQQVPTQDWIPPDRFAYRLRETRLELGLDVKEISAKCGISAGTWSGWENGNKPRNMAAVVSKIAQAINVDREWLMWGDGPRANIPCNPHLQQLRIPFKMRNDPVVPGMFTRTASSRGHARQVA